MLRSFSTEGNQEKERIDMDQGQKKGGWPPRWNNPFPVKKNSPSQSASGKAVRHDPSVQSHCLQPSQLNLLASFGLSREDLETLSHYPDDQLTPENMPLLLQAIQKSKLAPKVPVVPSSCPEKETPQSLRQCIEEETLLSADDCGCIVKKKVIDYGHKSKYGYNEAVPVVKGSSVVVNESKERFQTPKAASGPAAAPSRVTSNPKSPSEELPGQPGFQTSTPNAQAKPPVDLAPKAPPKELGVPADVPPVMQPGVLPIPKPPAPAKIRPMMHPVAPPVPKPAMIPVLPVKVRAMDQRPPPFAPRINKTLGSHERLEQASRADPLSDPCQGAGGQKNFWVEEPIRSPFGVVKASWLPTFLNRDVPVTKLPTSSQMNDYFAVTPKMFPHVCSLCNEDCENKTGWIQHQNTSAHMVNCRWLVQNHPGWTPDPSCLSERHEDHRQEKHQSRQRSASPSPKRSRRSDHSRHRTPSQSSHDSHSTSRARSRTPSQSRSHDSHRTSRARSRTPSQSRSHDSHRTSRARSRTPSQSRSHDSHRTSRARSRTPSQSRSRDSHRTSRATVRTPSQSRSRDSHRTSRATGRTPSQSRSRDSHRMSRARSRTRSRSRNRDSHKTSRARSRTRSRSRNRDSHKTSRARSRTRSRSRSRDYHRTSQARSRSPKHLSSPRHRSKSPRQSQDSSGRSSSSKDRGSGSSSRSSEGQHATAPSSRKKHDEQKQTDSSSDCREKRREDPERTREEASCQKQPVDKTGSKKKTHKKLVPEGQSHEQPERSALASLTEKSVLQAMAQLQAQGAAEGSFNQGRSSAELAAGAPDTSAVSSDLVSMIQRVATQVITAVLDSKGASATRAKTRTREPDPQKVNSATRKPKSQSVAPREGTARSREAKGKSLVSPRPKKRTSLSGEAKNKQEAGLCPKAGKAKSKPKAGALRRERTSLCSKAKNEPAVNPGVSPGTAAKGKEENKCVAGQWSKQAVASSDKAEKESGIGFAPHQGTTERDTVENQGVVTACPQQGAPVSSKSENQGVLGVCPQQGAPESSKSENQGVLGVCSQQGAPESSKSENQGVLGVYPQQGAPESSKSENQGVLGVYPQQGAPESSKSENQGVLGVCPQQGAPESSKSENQGVLGVCPQQGAPESSKSENQGVLGVCPQQGAPESSKSENQGVLGVCPQQGAPESSKSENQGVVIVCPQQDVPVSCTSKNQGVAGACPQQGASVSSTSKSQDVVGVCPQQGALESIMSKTQGVAGVFPQQGAPKSSMSKNQGVAVVCPLQGASVSFMSKNQGVVGASPQRDVPESSMLKNHGMVGVCPQQSAPVSCTSKNQGVVIVCPQQGVPVSCTSKNQGVAGACRQQGASVNSTSKNRDVVGVCPQQSTPESSMSKNQGVAGACPQQGASVSSTSKNRDVVGVCPQQGTPESSMSKNQGVTGACPQQGASVSSTSKNRDVVGVCPQQGTPESSMSKNQGVTGACPQQGASVSSTSKNRDVVGVCPQQGTPESSMSKNQGVAGACPQQGTPANSKSENQGMASHSLNKGTARNGKAECLHVVGRSPNKGTAGSGATENKCPEVPSSQQQISLNSKRGSQDTELKLVPGNSCPRSGSVSLTAKPRVWICGDSLVVSAQKRASKTAIGSKLGLQKSIILEWQREDSLKWIQLKPFLQKVINCHQPPDVLIVHLGEEDFAHAVKYDLISRMKGEFILLAKLSPQLRVIWSEIIPPGLWHGEYEHWKLRHFNYELSQLILQHGGAVIKHPAFTFEDPKLYIDKANLSSAGLDIFLKDIRNGISAHVLQSGRASRALARLGSVSQKVATQMSEVVSSSKEASGMQTNTGEAAASTQPARKEAQNSGVASPSSQPGTSGICKAEKRNAKQGLVVKSIPFFSGIVSLRAKPRVWICGDSLVVSAQKRASRTSAGSQLGLEESIILEWHGQDSLKWVQLLPFLQNLVTGRQAPNLLIVHLGEEDFAYAAKNDLVNQVRGELTLLTKLFPRAKVIWSEIIPQGFWHGEKAYWARKRLNLALGQPLESYGGVVLKHPGISSEDSKLYIDKANLSDAGLDIFLEDIENGICAHLLQSSKAARRGLNKRLSLPPPATPAAPAGLSSASEKVATQAIEVVSSSKEASSTQTNSREATVSSQPVRNMAENSGVASPSPPPRTFGACKAEKQELELRLIDENVLAPCSVTCEQVTKPRVWICGDSLVASAQKLDLEKRLFGEPDRLQQRVVVEWHGQEDLTWTQLVPTLRNLAAQGQAPDVLIIHLGKKDLLRTPWLELSGIIKTEVALLKEVFPKVRLIWSEMLPQPIFSAPGEACEAEKVLEEANLVVGELISSFGGAVIKHSKTSNSFPVFKVNGNDLSHIGLELFLENIRNGIRVHVLQDSGTTGINEVSRLFSFAPLPPPAGLGSVSQEVTLQGTEGVSFSSEILQIPSNVGDAAISTQPAVPMCRRRNMQTFKFGSSHFCSGSVRPSAKPRVWICGDSLVVSAQKRASRTATGSQLGLEESIILEWHGQDNLKWIQLLPFLQNLVTGRQAPNVLIIHLGEEDLAQAMKDNLINRVIREFFLLTTLFPRVRVIWSEIVPQGVWPGEEGCLKRKILNSILRKSFESHEGAVIEHCRLSSEDPKLYIDKANLSDAGLDIFLEDIKNGICAHVSAARAPTGLGFLSQKVATQTGEAASSPEEASVMQTDTREVTVSPQTVSSRAENSGVASPNTQPEPSGTCKTEKQDVKQELVVKSIPPCPGSPGPRSKPCIWILGHGVVALAQERAVTSGIGSQLGLEEKVALQWHGYCGLSWVELIPLLQDLASYYRAPDVLIIHLGENDLYTQSVDFLIRRIKEELHLVRQLFPSAKVMWSDMMRWGSDLDKPNTVNISVGKSVKHFGGAVIGHPRILSGEWCFDKADLLNTGLDIFLEDIKAGICAHVLQSRGAASGRLGKGTRLPASASPAAPVARGSVSKKSAIQVEEASSAQTDVGEPAASSLPVSCEAEQSSVASPSLQRGTSENQDVEEKLVPGDIPPRPGGAAVSPQPVSIQAEISGEAGPSPQPETSRTIKVEKQDEDLKLVSGSALDPCPGGAAVSPQPKSIKAEIPGEAGPSPQPETSGTCKAEKQEVKLEPVDEHVLAPCPGNPEQASKRRVWICGQSVVTSAEKQASSTEAGSQLGLDESAILEWHGQEGLTWTQLVPTLQSLAAEGQAPDVLIIHLGEEDTECHRAAHLNDIIKKELVLVKEFLPLVRILWSNVLLRRRGFGTGGSRTVNRARTMVNQEMGQFISTLGGAVIDHPAILHTDPDFYIDGDNLSGRGLDIFLEDLRRAILAHLHSC